jgi:hypothetical protein
MTQRITTNTILIFLFGLLILGLAACGSDSTSVVSQTDDATNDTQSVVAVEESHDDEDGHADGLVDEPTHISQQLKTSMMMTSMQSQSMTDTKKRQQALTHTPT